MARKAIVDKEIILSMLKAGETTQRIAEKFSVSRQAIDLHRKDFIGKGLLPDRRAARSKKQPSTESGNNAAPQTEGYPRQPVSVSNEKPENKSTISLDTHIDLIINAFSALKRLPSLERELELYRLENERMKQELDKLTLIEKKRIEQENRWMLIRNDDFTRNSSS